MKLEKVIFFQKFSINQIFKIFTNILNNFFHLNYSWYRNEYIQIFKNEVFETVKIIFIITYCLFGNQQFNLIPFFFEFEIPQKIDNFAEINFSFYQFWKKISEIFLFRKLMKKIRFKFSEIFETLFFSDSHKLLEKEKISFTPYCWMRKSTSFMNFLKAEFFFRDWKNYWFFSNWNSGFSKIRRLKKNYEYREIKVFIY